MNPANEDATRDLPFANLTRPIADLIRSSPQSHNVLGQVLRLHEERVERDAWHGGSPEWAIFTTPGAILVKLGAGHMARVRLRFHSTPDTMGPDELVGDTLHVDRTDLPDTVLRGIVGSRMAEVVDGRRLHHVLDEAIIKRAWRHGMGLRFRLDVPTATLRLVDLPISGNPDARRQGEEH